MGVRWYGKGAYDRGAVTTETVKAKSLFRAHMGDFVFNRIDTQNGAFDVVSPDLDGALATNEFPLYITDPSRLLAPFLLLYFQQESVRAAIDRTRAGSEGRARWKEADFEAWQIPLPPLAEQHRIVDLLTAVDDQIHALEAEASALSVAWRASLSDLGDTDRVGLGSALDAIQTGTSPKGEERIPGEGERAVLKISAVGQGTFRPTEVKTVASDIQLNEDARVRRGDVLLVRCNAVIDRVGAVCRVPDEDPGPLYLCDKTLRLVPHPERLDADFLANVMWAPAVREQIAARATGSDMRNISQKALREIEVPLPSISDQREIGARLRGLTHQSHSLRREAMQLTHARTALLSAFLSQDVEIPSAYDRFVEEVA